jgi:hypothetical protein
MLQANMRVQSNGTSHEWANGQSSLTIGNTAESKFGNCLQADSAGLRYHISRHTDDLTQIIYYINELADVLWYIHDVQCHHRCQGATKIGWYCFCDGFSVMKELPPTNVCEIAFNSHETPPSIYICAKPDTLL